MTAHDIFFFCDDLSRDPCASNVFREVASLPGVSQADVEFDGFPVLCARRVDGSIGFFVRTKDVVSNDYARYAGAISEHFENARLAIVVNWHEGANAPDNVITFHSTGDVTAGVYGPTAPSMFSAYTRALERERSRGTLSDYKTLVEATHWSGVMYGSRAEQINAYHRPIYDMEIGSSSACWSDPRACGALARVCVFGPEPTTDGSTIIYCGGVHFEENVTAAVLSGRWHVGHVLPNHWLVAGDYATTEGRTKLESCLISYLEIPTLIALHKGLASKFRESIVKFADTAKLASITHKQMRDGNGILKTGS
jgi:D-tyrosyl-tRNA(Tyr) deacylase